jgi:predicted RNA binding protein YcfA (HicA-like mRNA interferase family)
MTVPVPGHPGDAPKGLIRKIIKERGMTVKEFNEL